VLAFDECHTPAHQLQIKLKNLPMKKFRTDVKHNYILFSIKMFFICALLAHQKKRRKKEYIPFDLNMCAIIS